MRFIRIGISALACCLLILPAIASKASKKGRILTQEEVATTWVGLDHGELRFYRLSLEVNGKGLGAILSRADDEPMLFSIDSWHYRSGRIGILGESIPVGERMYAPRFSGEVIGTAMRLVEKGDDWEREVELRREAKIIDIWKVLESAMNDAREEP